MLVEERGLESQIKRLKELLIGKDFEQLNSIIEELESIKTYEAGKPIEWDVREFGIQPKDIIKLASNENPYGCSSKVQESIVNIVANMDLYPADSMTKLKNAISNSFEVEDENKIIDYPEFCKNKEYRIKKINVGRE